jgi:hypothetical protein
MIKKIEFAGHTLYEEFSITEDMIKFTVEKPYINYFGKNRYYILVLRAVIDDEYKTQESAWIMHKKWENNKRNEELEALYDDEMLWEVTKKVEAEFGTLYAAAKEKIMAKFKRVEELEIMENNRKLLEIASNFNTVLDDLTPDKTNSFKHFLRNTEMLERYTTTKRQYEAALQTMHTIEAELHKRANAVALDFVNSHADKLPKCVVDMLQMQAEKHKLIDFRRTRWEGFFDLESFMQREE